MHITEKILHQIQGLPETKQAEVLDFVEFLRARLTREENSEWTNFSIAAAMHGMEQEPAPYSLNDLKEAFK